MALELEKKQLELPARELLHLMAVAREGDRREGILLRQGNGWFQVSATGHEALAAIGFALEPGDYIFPYYRDRALVMSRGVSNYDLALAYFAKANSSSAGRQMPGHFSDREHNVFSVATPTASQCLPAAGAAWGFAMSGSHQVALTTIGDAASREGEFYEALAFALQESLPVIFVIEDNHYGISTPTAHHFPYRLGVLGKRALVKVDAHDPDALYAVASEAARKARHGDGPTVLWCDMDRLCSHTSSDDQRVYVDAGELEASRMRDPLKSYAELLIERNLLTEEEWGLELSEIARQVDVDYMQAAQEPDPDPAHILDHLFAASVPSDAPLLNLGEDATMVSAVNATLGKALAENPRVLIFGEDVEDPKGGVFGLTKGLSKRFPKRVVNSPLAEATILGAAVGLGGTGWLPIFEVQFTDFICPALNQLMSQAASLRWRSAGAWSCPMVIIAPYGAYLPGGGLWHSASNEGMWAHIQGINVIIPSTSADAAGLLWTAIHGEDPTLFLLPKHIFRQRMATPQSMAPIPLGQAAIRREGSDVTVVSWGNCLELCAEAANHMGEDGVSVELIDLRCIVPCDWSAIERSLAKTGRLVVVHEDARTTGFGQAIVAEMTSHTDRWNSFLSPPQIVARADVHVPYNPVLEYAILPDVERVVAAIRVTME